MKFNELKLKPKLLESIKNMNFKEATGIQAKCIPLILEGRDVIGQSLTGSGKTAAFGIPILNKVNKGVPVQALILTPTRELAQQVKENLEDLGRLLGIKTTSVYGGVGFDRQLHGIRTSEIIVGTPGRLLDHLGRRTLSLKNIEFIILDEADRMFDMGFEKDVKKILSFVKGKKQTILFSATMPNAAKEIAKKYLDDPKHVKEKSHVDESLLKHSFYTVDGEKKFSLLVHLLEKVRGSAIVFCRTKRGVDRLNKSLKKHKIVSMAVHGDITQNKRMLAVKMFKDGKIDVLVATDVAARGIDISGVSHVYNFDVPKENEDYTHRVGRTARAGKKGEAISIVARYDARDFEKILNKRVIIEEKLPEFETLQMSKKEMGGDDRRGSGGRGFGGRGGRSSFGGRGGRGGSRNGRDDSRRRTSGGQKSSGGRKRYSGNNDDSSEGSSRGRSYGRSSSDRSSSDRSSSKRTTSKDDFHNKISTYKSKSGDRSSSRGRDSYSDRDSKPRGKSNYSSDRSSSRGRDSYSDGGDSKPRGGSNYASKGKPRPRSGSRGAGRSSSDSSTGKSKPRRRSNESATRGFTNSGKSTGTSPKTFNKRKRARR
jgi:ATP-dependent RNA helicase DeaD